jgi:circadian clock protein KaiB
MANFQLTLYVSGKTVVRSERTIANLRRILEEEVDGEYELNVCDVLEEPQLAEKDKVLATPTLILRSPPPARRIVGDLSDAAKVLPYLGLTSRGRADERKGSREKG